MCAIQQLVSAPLNPMLPYCPLLQYCRYLWLENPHEIKGKYVFPFRKDLSMLPLHQAKLSENCKWLKCFSSSMFVVL